MTEHDARWWMRQHAAAANWWTMMAAMVEGRRNEDVFSMLAFQHIAMVQVWQLIAGPTVAVAYITE